MDMTERQNDAVSIQMVLFPEFSYRLFTGLLRHVNAIGNQGNVGPAKRLTYIIFNINVRSNYGVRLVDGTKYLRSTRSAGYNRVLYRLRACLIIV